MAQWRKVVVSGSNAVLNEVTASGAIVPKTDDTVDLGSSALEFKDLYIDGTAYLDSATITAGTITGITDLAIADGGTGASSLNNLITLGDHTTGTYISTITPGSGVLLDQASSATSTETATPTLSIDSGSMAAYYSSSAFSVISGDVAITSAGVATVTGATTNAALTAGAGISAGGTFDGATARTFALDINELTAEAIATGDTIAFNDSGDNGQHKETIDDIATLFAGTGLTATNAVLAVDASQTQITSVGTIGTGVWQGTAVADTYVANDLTISGGTVNNSVIGGTTPAAITGTTITGTAISGSSVSSSGAVVAAGGFYGDGSNITNLTAAAISSYTNTGNNRILTSVDSSTANSEANLTFDGTDVVVAGGGKVAFRDNGGEYIYSVSDNVLGLVAGSEIDLTATTIDINGLVDISGNLTVGGDLDVNGTTTTINTANSYITDKFMIMASGSTSDTDGGIIVQNAAGSGYALGYDSGVDRWAFDADLAHNATALGPDAYVGVVQVATTDGDSLADPIYGGGVNGVGTIYVDTDDSEIWIFA